MDKHEIGKQGLIIFDGSCGACSTLVGRRKSFFEKHGFTVAPYQEHWVQQLCELDEATLAQAIHLRLNSGELLKGIDFFAYLASSVFWLKPLGFLLSIKALRPVFDKLYDFIAARRQKISKACGLQDKAFYK